MRRLSPLTAGLVVLAVSVFIISHADAENLVPENLSPPREADPIEVVVSATRSEIPKEEEASAVTIISGEDLQRVQESSVADALRTVPSTDVVRSGGPGGNTSVFLRGANPEHTLVLIDGIEVNNPVTPSRVFNFADLASINIDRIEILRGPQSTLYGSDAMGGVINIITKKGEGDPKLYASSEAGSYGTFTQKAGGSGGSEVINYSAGFMREDSENISAADASFGNSEHDRYGNSSFSGRLGVNPSDNVGLQGFLRYADALSLLDNCGGFGCDDRNRKARDKQLFTRVEADTNFLDNSLSQVLGASFTNQHFSDNNDPDPDMLNLDLLRSQYTGSTSKVDLQNTWKASDSVTFIAGAETQRETAESDYHSDGPYGPYDSDFEGRSATNSAYYLEGIAKTYDALFTSAGVRADTHSKTGTEVTWRVAPAVLFRETGTKFSTTIGTGFKSPSLFQLYSSYGNQDLKAEQSIGMDAGVEQALMDRRVVVSAAFFYNRFKDLITFDPNTFLFSNVANANSRGLEFGAELKLADNLSFVSTYTLCDTKDKETGLALLRRARNKASMGLRYDVDDRLKLTLTTYFSGRRYDNNYSTFPVERVALGGYGLVDAAASYNVSKGMQLFARVENMLDHYYEEVFGFGTRGAAAYGGVRFEL